LHGGSFLDVDEEICSGKQRVEYIRRAVPLVEGAIAIEANFSKRADDLRDFQDLYKYEDTVTQVVI
jgi:hypothetical protein